MALGGHRDGGPVQRQVLLVAVDVAHQLHQRQGAGGAHSQAVVLRPRERLQPADRGQERDDGLPPNRYILRPEEKPVVALGLRLYDYISGL